MNGVEFLAHVLGSLALGPAVRAVIRRVDDRELTAEDAIEVLRFLTGTGEARPRPAVTVETTAKRLPPMSRRDRTKKGGRAMKKAGKGPAPAPTSGEVAFIMGLGGEGTRRCTCASYPHLSGCGEPAAVELSGETHRELLAFLCPWCQQRVAVVEALANGALGAIHTLPTCPTFDRLEVDDYLHEVRLKVVGPQPDDPEWPRPGKVGSR